MTAHDDDALLAVAAELAWAAADLVLALRARGCETETKPDASVVTEADRRAETSRRYETFAYDSGPSAGTIRCLLDGGPA